MPAYILRDIDTKLWDAVKARAAKDGHNLRWVLLALLRIYAKHGLNLMTAPTLLDREETYCQSCGNAPDDGERCVICGRAASETTTPS